MKRIEKTNVFFKELIKEEKIKVNTGKNIEIEIDLKQKKESGELIATVELRADSIVNTKKIVIPEKFVEFIFVYNSITGTDKVLIENGYLIHLEKRDKNNNNVFYQELSFDQKVKLLLEYVNNFADTNTISDLSSNKLIIAKDTMELIHKHATEDRQLKTA